MANFFVTGTPATWSPYKNTPPSSLSPRLEFHPFVLVLTPPKRGLFLQKEGAGLG
jgi:hypothetical protein